MPKDEKLDIAPACAKSDIWLFSGASKRRVSLELQSRTGSIPLCFLRISELKVCGTRLWKFER
jgi:hypothetical protein